MKMLQGFKDLAVSVASKLCSAYYIPVHFRKNKQQQKPEALRCRPVPEDPPSMQETYSSISSDGVKAMSLFVSAHCHCPALRQKTREEFKVKVSLDYMRQECL